MKSLILFIFLSPILAQAECPIAINDEDNSYCASIEWDTADRKHRGEFENTTRLSPQLVFEGEVTQKWLYSKAKIEIWKKGDASQTPIKLRQLNIFPYMIMKNGHHHSASYNFKETSSNYEIGEMTFQQMQGCWSLRWSFSKNETKKDSQLFTYINSFTNLSDETNSALKAECLELEGNNRDHGHGSHKH